MQKSIDDSKLDNSEWPLHIGAQGPDIFFHNQRTMPSGLLIGSVLHRKGYGSVSARMMEHCLLHDKTSKSIEGIYTVAFISHAILDRIMHPYINYFSGWVDHDNPSTRKYKYCHPFFERILDLAIAAYKRPDLLNNASTSIQPLAEYNFADKFDAGDNLPGEIENLLVSSLVNSYSRMAKDEKIQSRIRNAYGDSRGFYHFSEGSRSSEIPLRWAALLHPHKLPGDVDFINFSRRLWLDPCDDSLSFDADVHMLFDSALELAVKICEPVKNMLDGEDPPEQYAGLPSILGDHGLRNNIVREDNSSPCTLTHCDPLPLRDMLGIIADGKFPDDWKPVEAIFLEQN